MNQPAEDYVQQLRRCQHCAGAGYIPGGPYCEVCEIEVTLTSTRLSQSDLASSALSAVQDVHRESIEVEMLSCGHPREYMAERLACPTCGGQGRSLQWLSPAEVQAIERGKKWRSFFLLLLTLVTVSGLWMLLWYTSSADQPLCGVWWYFWIAPLAVGMLGKRR